MRRYDSSEDMDKIKLIEKWSQHIVIFTEMLIYTELWAEKILFKSTDIYGAKKLFARNLILRAIWGKKNVSKVILIMLVFTAIWANNKFFQKVILKQRTFP